MKLTNTNKYVLRTIAAGTPVTSADRTHVARLVAMGFVVVDGGRVQITDAGRAMLAA